MNGYKAEITLNEKDSLTDILIMEKELVKQYATAITEGASRGYRSVVKNNMETAVQDQFSVFTVMNKQGLYEVQPADKAIMDKQKQTFCEELSQLS